MTDGSTTLRTNPSLSERTRGPPGAHSTQRIHCRHPQCQKSLQRFTAALYVVDVTWRREFKLCSVHVGCVLVVTAICGHLQLTTEFHLFQR